MPVLNHEPWGYRARMRARIQSACRGPAPPGVLRHKAGGATIVSECQVAGQHAKNLVVQLPEAMEVKGNSLSGRSTARGAATRTEVSVIIV